MDDQAQVKGDRPNGRPEGVVGSLADFGNDVATLAELQVKLAALDLKEATGRATLPLVLIAVGAVLIIGCVPVAVAGLAVWLGGLLGLSLGVSLLLTGLALMVVAAVVAGLAARRLRGSVESFRRSTEELNRNISWIRTVLVHSGRPAPRRRW
jgi:hypothetical protein